MSRFSFGLYGVVDSSGQANNEVLAGQTVRVKNDSTGEVVASTSPTGEQLPVIDNGDGSYYVDGLPTGLYTVYVNSETVAQDELSHLPHIADAEIAHFSDAPKHRLINDSGSGATDLFSASKILALLGDKANQTDLEALITTVAGKSDQNHNHNDSYLQATGVSGDFQINENQLKFNPDFSKAEILDQSKTLNQNLELLQSAILNLLLSGSSKRIIFVDTAENLSGGASLSFPVYVVGSEGTDWEYLRIWAFSPISGDSELKLTFEMTSTKTDAVITPVEAKLSIGSKETEVELRGSNINGTYGVYTLTINLSGLSIGSIYTVALQGRNTEVSGELRIRKLELSVS